MEAKEHGGAQQIENCVLYRMMHSSWTRIYEAAEETIWSRKVSQLVYPRSLSKCDFLPLLRK
jgi:hypothetical protein